MQWTEKYRPKNFEEIKGQEKVIEEVKEFVENFPSNKKAILLGGPPGTGKTTIVHVFSKEFNWELFELNASDLRNKTKLLEILKPVLEQKSLEKEKKIILIDEVDGISEVDKGGITELIDLIENTNYPIIATANDLWKRKLAPLRKVTQIIEVKEVRESAIKNVLIEILKKENKFLKLEVINELTASSKGDLRAAINDLQTASLLEYEGEILIDRRNKEENIFNIIRDIFQKKADKEMLLYFDKTDIPLEEIPLWIEENIPKVYSDKELTTAYEKLSKSDIFKGRIYKQQYWRFLVYQNILLSYGIASSKENEKNGFYKYLKPSRILKIWLSNQRLAKKKSIAEKYAKKVHIGYRRIMGEWNEVKSIIKNPIIQKELRLTLEEKDYLKTH